VRDYQYLRTLRKVFTCDIDPGNKLGSKIVDGWFVFDDQEDFELDGKRVDHALVEYEDRTTEEVIIVR